MPADSVSDAVPAMAAAAMAAERTAEPVRRAPWPRPHATGAFGHVAAIGGRGRCR